MITIEHDASGSSVWGSDDWPSAVYALGMHAPRYPMPALTGIVEYVNYPDALEIIITDCDERYDPRLCFAVMRHDSFVIDDYPHDSPNYR